MLLLAAIASATTTTMIERPSVQARVTVRIERPVTASAEQWERLPASRRREILIRDERGRLVFLRLIENE